MDQYKILHIRLSEKEMPCRMTFVIRKGGAEKKILVVATKHQPCLGQRNLQVIFCIKHVPCTELEPVTGFKGPA